MALTRESQALTHQLSPNEVVVYLCDLRKCGADALGLHRTLLSARELEKNSAMGHEELRTRDANCRGLLRRHLAHLLEISPTEVGFAFNENGKPLLDDTAATLHFNLSHSGDYAAIGLCATAPIGVDLEYTRCNRDTARLATRFFSTRESEALNQLPDALGRKQFYRLWTLKEAYVKARGDSIASGLQTPRFRVEETHPGGLQEEHLHEDVEDQENWRLWSAAIPSHYQLAIALRDASKKRVKLCESPLLEAEAIP